MRRFNSRILLTGTAVVLLAACGGRGEKADSDAEDTAAAQEEAEAQPEPAPAATPPAGESSSAPLTVADIDRWQRGLDAELKAVREAGQRLKAARNGTDTLDAMMAANDMATRAAGAKAAGVGEERYQFIRTSLSSAVANISPIEQEIGMANMPPAMLEEMKKGREAALANMTKDVPPPVIEALRPRAAELRRQDVALAFERLKAAGGG